MRHALALVALVSTMSAAAPALAQSNATARCSNTPANGDARDQTFCFEAENVGAGVVGPDGQRSQLIRQMHGPSLLRIRAHFVNEMLKSVENL